VDTVVIWVYDTSSGIPADTIPIIPIDSVPLYHPDTIWIYDTTGTIPSDTTPKREYSYIDSVPFGSNIPYGRVSAADIPYGWTTVAPWMVAVHNQNLGSTSQVQVKDFEIYSVSYAGVTTLLASANYGPQGFNSTDKEEGGLYSKYPTWFKSDTHARMAASVIDGVLVFNPSTEPDKIWHWWTKRALIPSDCYQIIVTAKVLLSGGACVQAGADWWKGYDLQWNGLNVNNTEVMASNWYFSSPTWQTITISNR
jgi:hypothetical protein